VAVPEAAQEAAVVMIVGVIIDEDTVQEILILPLVQVEQKPEFSIQPTRYHPEIAGVKVIDRPPAAPSAAQLPPANIVAPPSVLI
jgi:hypothetical protein